MRRLLPGIVWALFIAACSSTVIGPKAFVGGASRTIGVSREGFQTFWDAAWWVFVKGFHALEFALLAILLRRGGLSTLLAFVATVGWAALDEWHQTFVPRRGGHVSDVLIDAAGAATVLLLLLLLLIARWRRRPQAVVSHLPGKS